jgi:hypothetical protein
MQNATWLLYSGMPANVTNDYDLMITIPRSAKSRLKCSLVDGKIVTCNALRLHSQACHKSHFFVKTASYEPNLHA